MRPVLGAVVLATAAATLTAAPASLASSAAPTISFRVVEPDGTPVVHPIVVVSVFGPTYPDVQVLAGGAAGQVVVPFPAGDPVASAALAAGDAVNLMIRVFDKEPGSADINAAYVTAAIGMDPFGTLAELSGVSGSTIPLATGRTDFHEVTGDITGNVGANPWQPRPDYCVPPTYTNTPFHCYKADYPPWAAHTLVPIAYNHGGGADMFSSIVYTSTKVTTTSGAIQVGKSGYFQANGQLAFEEENDVALPFGDVGPNANDIASLDTTFKRERAGWCMYLQESWKCQVEATYRPYQAQGPYQESNSSNNDRMNIVHDCWAPVKRLYEPTTKSSKTTTFSFTLGPDENWATGAGAPGQANGFYANTTYTQQTHTGTSLIRRWTVLPPSQQSQPFHYVYVPFGKDLAPVGTVPNSKCVATHLGDVQTDAEDVNYNETVDHADRYGIEDPTDNEQATEAPICGNMPDRCD